MSSSPKVAVEILLKGSGRKATDYRKCARGLPERVDAGQWFGPEVASGIQEVHKHGYKPCIVVLFYRP